MTVLSSTQETPFPVRVIFKQQCFQLFAFRVSAMGGYGFDQLPRRPIQVRYVTYLQALRPSAEVVYSLVRELRSVSSEASDQQILDCLIWRLANGLYY